MQIIHVDEHLLIVNKPAGLSVLPEGWDKDASYLVKILEEQFGNPSTALRHGERKSNRQDNSSGQGIWVVHRIDKITSGVIIFALTAEAHRSLNIQFERHQVEKIYHAILTGSPKWDEKTTKFPLRVNVGHKHRTMVDNKNGVRSETRFRILKRYQACPELVEGLALAEASPMTGRTHQIRVHAYALGHPLLGDVLYSAPEIELIPRPALHAYSIKFTHPNTNEAMNFQAEYPQDFQSVVNMLIEK